MLKYKNTSLTAKTFYGVTFKPGETKQVPGYINYPNMVRVSAEPKELPKAAKKAEKPVAEKPTATKSVDLEPETAEETAEENTNKSKQTKQGGESDGSDNNK